MPTKKTQSLKSTTKSVEVKKVVTGKGIPDKEPDIKISDDVVSALVNGFKGLSERLDKLVEKVSDISACVEALVNGDASIPIQVERFNDSIEAYIDSNLDSLPITIKEFQDDISVAVYNKNDNFTITGSIEVNGDLTVKN